MWIIDLSLCFEQVIFLHSSVPYVACVVHFKQTGLIVLIISSALCVLQ